jgi:hypothetical protein
MDEIGIDVGERGTNFAALYGFDPSSHFDEGAFAGLVRVDEGENDSSVDSDLLNLLRIRYGVRVVEPFDFLMLADESSAAAALSWIVQESARPSRTRFSGTLPHWEGLALELGDVVLSSSDEAAGKAFRLISRQFNPTSGQVSVTFEEVVLWDGQF